MSVYKDFGPIRLVLPPIKDALTISSNIATGIKLVKAAQQGNPAALVLVKAQLATRIAAIYSAKEDADGNPQTWGDSFRGKTNLLMASSMEDINMDDLLKLNLHFEEMGAGIESLAEFLDLIEEWINDEIVIPISKGEKMSGFFGKKKGTPSVG